MTVSRHGGEHARRSQGSHSSRPSSVSEVKTLRSRGGGYGSSSENRSMNHTSFLDPAANCPRIVARTITPAVAGPGSLSGGISLETGHEHKVPACSDESRKRVSTRSQSLVRAVRRLADVALDSSSARHRQATPTLRTSRDPSPISAHVFAFASHARL
jgi:hypothetical protein